VTKRKATKFYTSLYIARAADGQRMAPLFFEYKRAKRFCEEFVQPREPADPSESSPFALPVSCLEQVLRDLWEDLGVRYLVPDTDPQDWDATTGALRPEHPASRVFDLDKARLAGYSLAEVASALSAWPNYVEPRGAEGTGDQLADQYAILDRVAAAGIYTVPYTPPVEEGKCLGTIFFDCERAARFWKEFVLPHADVKALAECEDLPQPPLPIDLHRLADSLCDLWREGGMRWLAMNPSPEDFDGETGLPKLGHPTLDLSRLRADGHSWERIAGAVTSYPGYLKRRQAKEDQPGGKGPA
jgi:hypothetical protein